MAVSGLVDGSLTDATFHTAFKARTGEVVTAPTSNPVDGIYLGKGPGSPQIVTVVETGMDGTLIDPEAVFDDDEDSATPAVRCRSRRWASSATASAATRSPST